MKTNYHTHTKRCGHAYICDDEEYVLKAIEAGYKELGFSEHAMFSDIYDEYGMRPPYSDLEGYIESLNQLKEKYRNQITIYKAMECEYFEEYYNELKELLVSKKLDYLIFGNHYFKHSDGHIYSDKGTWTREDYYDLYVEKAIEALDSKLFTIFAHPDFAFQNINEWNEHIEKLSLKMLKKAKENDVYVEINLGGIRKGKWQMGNEFRYKYPYYKFWELVAKVGNKVIIGVDAHNPNDFIDDAYSKALEFASNLNINLEEKVVFKKI